MEQYWELEGPRAIEEVGKEIEKVNDKVEKMEVEVEVEEMEEGAGGCSGSWRELEQED